MPSRTVDFIMSGGNSSGAVANDSIFNAILNTINPGDSAVIYFPNGSYLFNQTLNLESNVYLVGQSADSTELKFDLGGSGDLISISGSQSSDTAHITQAINKDATSFAYSGSNLFNAGNFIRIIDNDSSVITST